MKSKPPRHGSVRQRNLAGAMRLIRQYGGHKAGILMSRAQYRAAISAIRHAVTTVKRHQGESYPTTVTYAGVTFRLAYSCFGQVLVCDRSGRRLLSSDYGVLED